MSILFEINPPKVIEDESDSESSERMHHLTHRLGTILDMCDGTLITDSVLGKPRFDPIDMAKMIKESHPNLETIVSMRTIDKTAVETSLFATRVKTAKISGILVVKGDPSNDNDSRLVPSTIAKMLNSTVNTYLSIPSKPNFVKIQKKINVQPAGFFTQIVKNIDDVGYICKKLTPMGFRIIPCILVPSQKNLTSAKFLNLDWSSYSDDVAGFIKSVHKIAGDVLLTSPSDIQTASNILKTI
ncbi:MAG: 5,10-methylenetetrahydrofolate reductase-like protein [Cenarchaeum symbiont of Oopsacas minuta]|nr:5,10-methylenetetrahydrofolate reductase-like protein [Cenarchaeum symbiont of Oopsacas minuta]